jgi:hypothetical protein
MSTESSGESVDEIRRNGYVLALLLSTSTQPEPVRPRGLPGIRFRLV